MDTMASTILGGVLDKSVIIQELNIEHDFSSGMSFTIKCSATNNFDIKKPIEWIKKSDIPDKYIYLARQNGKTNWMYEKFKKAIDDQIFNGFGVSEQMAVITYPGRAKMYYDGVELGSISGFDWYGTWTSICNNKEDEDMKLGQIVEIKDGLENIFDGELVMLAPGYDKDDFVVNVDEDDGEVTIIVKGDDDYKKNDEFIYDLAEGRKVTGTNATFINGVFRLKIEYTIDGNVEVKGE